MTLRHLLAVAFASIVMGFGLGGLLVTGNPSPPVSAFIFLAGVIGLITTLLHAYLNPDERGRR